MINNCLNLLYKLTKHLLLNTYSFFFWQILSEGNKKICKVGEKAQNQWGNWLEIVSLYGHIHIYIAFFSSTVKGNTNLW